MQIAENVFFRVIFVSDNMCKIWINADFVLILSSLKFYDKGGSQSK